MNVVERKGQGHAQPADSGSDFDQLSGAWQAFSEGIFEFQFVRMHGACQWCPGLGRHGNMGAK